MKTFIAIGLLFFAANFVSYAQSAGDSILSNENAVLRPLTLHKNQFRISSGVSFYMFNRQYDEHGNQEFLRDIGKAISSTSIPVRIRFGLLDFLELEGSVNYSSAVFREQGIILINSFSPLATEISNTIYKKGFQDLKVSINSRLPGYDKKVGLLISFGIGLPLADSKALQPEHSSIYDMDADYEFIRYIYRETWSTGSASIHFGSMLKFRLNKFGVFASGSFQFPVSTSQGKYWLHRKIHSEFDYRGVEYTYLTPKKLFIGLHGQYLVFPWFTADLELVYRNHARGWTEQTGKKVAINTMHQLLFNPGFEIVVTHRLWLQQRISLTLSGENSSGFIGIETSFLYNLFIR